MHCDCADDVFVEIHQVCDKIFTFPDSSVTQTDVMRLPCRQEPEKQTEFAKLWHQGYFDLVLVQFRAFTGEYKFATLHFVLICSSVSEN